MKRLVIKIKIIHAIVIRKTTSKMHSNFIIENYLFDGGNNQRPSCTACERRGRRFATKKEFLREFRMFF